MPTQANTNNQLLKNILTLIHEQRNTIKELESEIAYIKKTVDNICPYNEKKDFIKVDEEKAEESIGWRIW
jgi:hypothetical protein